MKVFLTGATGFVGDEILRELRACGHSTRILLRNPDSVAARELASQDGVETHRGDVTDSNTLRRALGGIDAVIHLVGIISEVGNSTFENVHTRGTENMVREAQSQGVKRFVQMSAMGTRPNAASRYHQTKWAAEESVRNSGLDCTIFRPSLIYGPHDHFVNLFAKIIRWSPIVPVPGRKDAKFQPLPIDAVAAAFVNCLNEPKAIGRTYDLCGEQTLSMAEMINVIARVLGKRRLKMRVPEVVARIQARILEWIFPVLLARAPPLNRDQLIMLAEDNVGNCRPANELFGLKMGTFEPGIAKYLKPA